MDLRLPVFLFCGRVLEGRAVFVVFLWLIGVARAENVSCPKAPAIRSFASSPRARGARPARGQSKQFFGRPPA